ncbi:MAG: UDP-N-acetylglucosamine 1-carboxyvinyltransferase [Gracilibacteraceae bacterium]|jgi:UDP-N-acetylglucosamine 1-carboxyvinyltransferase|nr:UDP-N-acetylglucosamine 1-carboxyvinyltransferase [Gracilibacteraceae bacterium]
MKRLVINGGKKLFGEIEVGGAKNAVLPIIAASLLSSEEVILEDVPDLLDVSIMSQVVCALGGEVARQGHTLRIKAENFDNFEAPFDLITKMRASIVIMGPVLARKGRVRISHPGGCAIGSRPVNWHLKGLESLGAEVRIDHGYLDVSAPKLTGARIYLDFPSVGATENILMAAAAAEGMTIIENAAQEPEIVDLANFINQMGGKIRGAGTNIITVEGVQEFSGTRHTIIPDRIEAGTFILMAAACGGDVLVNNVISTHLAPLLAKLDEAKVQYEELEDGIRVFGNDSYQAVDIKTQVHPGFPTDLQAPFLALLARAKGTAIVTENIFENRFMHVDELKRMGADLKVEGRSVIVQGVPFLNPATLMATDLRAGAALILAALTAPGRSEIWEIQHIDRGYENIETKLRGLGADIERVEE